MGKKSRLKKERNKNEISRQNKKNNDLEQRPLLEKAIKFFLYAALVTPLIVNSKFYFPFVGPKSLFFMGLAEVAFFLWLFLVVRNKSYRVKRDSVFYAFTALIVVFVLSAVFGVDPSRSFWSKYERMTGVLMWLHLYGFFLVLRAVFKTKKEWINFFSFSSLISIVVSLAALSDGVLEKTIITSAKEGGTLGNSSFLGSYLVFHFFFGLWLFFNSLREYIKAIGITAFLFSFLSVYLLGARAASLSMLGGAGLLILLFFAFQAKSKKTRTNGKILLFGAIVFVLIGYILLLLPNTFVHNKFIEKTNRARFVNWNMAWESFEERPLLGWGPENYILSFTRHFNSCLFVKDCGREVWFDRSHNIIFDFLAAKGISGFLIYLSLFGFTIRMLWKKKREGRIDFFSAGVFTALLTAYFVQNTTVFDMVGSLMPFAAVLAFSSQSGNEEKVKFSPPQKGQAILGVLLLGIFAASFAYFVYLPAKKGMFTIEAIHYPANQEKRLEYYKKAENVSPMGKYQVREFLARKSEDIIKKEIRKNEENKMSQEKIKKELDLVLSFLQKTEKQSPLDYRSILRIAYINNLYSLLDNSKIEVAEKYAQKALELSPNNQQGYWAMAQVKLLQRKFEESIRLYKKAVELEPRYLQSYALGVNAADTTGEEETKKNFAQEGLNYAEMAIKEYPGTLQYYKSAISFAQILDKKEKINEIYQRAVTRNPAWEKEFRK